MNDIDISKIEEDEGGVHLAISRHSSTLGSSVEELVIGARRSVEMGLNHQAEAFYRVLLAGTTPPKTGVERVAHGEACRFYGLKALSKKRMGEAGDWYREALEADPLAIDYRIELVKKVLMPMGLTEAARQEAEKATKIDPKSSDAWRALGAVEYELGYASGTKKAYQKAFDLEPDSPISYLNQAAIELDLANYDKAREFLEIVQERWPECMDDIYHCYAMVAYREGLYEDSISLYTKAIEAGCRDPAQAQWNRSQPLQAIGRFKEGWADAEARGIQTSSAEFGIALRRFNAPLLELEKHPPPARVHLHEEMGYGDTLSMLRYIPLLSKMGYDVRVEVREPLVELVQRSFPNVRVMDRAPDYPKALGIPAFDYHHSLLSLPYVFGTEVSTIPWKGPYLKPDPEKVASYKERLPEGKKIGLVWSAGVRKGVWLTTYGLRKSIALKELTRVCDSIDAVFLSLQAGPERSELKHVAGVYDLLPEEPTWDDTAALIQCLDLVITVDTSVSHLAGAMGKPTWVMWSASAATWHYFADVDGEPWQYRSPWYPNTRVYRQKEAYQWADVISSIRKDLHSI